MAQSENNPDRDEQELAEFWESVNRPMREAGIDPVLYDKAEAEAKRRWPTEAAFEAWLENLVSQNSAVVSAKPLSEWMNTLPNKAFGKFLERARRLQDAFVTALGSAMPPAARMTLGGASPEAKRYVRAESILGCPDWLLGITLLRPSSGSAGGDILCASLDFDGDPATDVSIEVIVGEADGGVDELVLSVAHPAGQFRSRFPHGWEDLVAAVHVGAKP